MLQLVRTLLLQVLSSDEKASVHTRGHLDAYCFANFLHPPQLALHLLFGASWSRTHGVQLFASRLDLLSVPDHALARDGRLLNSCAGSDRSMPDYDAKG